MTKNRILPLLTLLVAALFTQICYAQERGSLKYFAQMNVIGGKGDYAPFWLTANRNGISSVDVSNGYARYGMSYSSSFGKKDNFSYTLVADIVAGYNQQSSFIVQQAYGELNWKALTLSIGSKEQWSESEHFAIYGNSESHNSNYGLQEIDCLGSGGLIFSGNSRPIPQVRAEVADFTDFPGTDSWLKFRGHISYGMFTDQNYQEEFTRINPDARYARNILYHSKALFLKVGKPERFPLTVEGGLEMHTEFSGDIYTHKDGLKISMPRKPMDFIKALIPLSGSDDTPTVEQTNISGNQLGNWHLAMTLHNRFADIRLYGEHLFEDFSQLFFIEYQQNKEGKRRIIYYPWRDIKIGINIRNKSQFLPFISNIRYEYITTRDQSGALYHDPSEYFNEQMDGCDNYYNHGIYPGWHHWGMAIGTPLAISPVYNTNGSTQFRSSRFIAHNVGLNGYFKGAFPLSYRVNYTYSENWGTYAHPFNDMRYTTSLLANVTYAPVGSRFAGSIAVGYDKSNFIGENIGIMLTLTHSGTLFGK